MRTVGERARNTFARNVAVWPYSTWSTVCAEIIVQYFWMIDAVVWTLSILWFLTYEVAVFGSIRALWGLLVVVMARSLFCWRNSNFILEELVIRFRRFILISRHPKKGLQNRHVLTKNLGFSTVCKKSSPKDNLQIKLKIMNNTFCLQIERKWNYFQSTWPSYSATQNRKSRLYCEP